MLHSLALKTLRDSRRGLLLWSLGLIGMVALMMAVYPTVRDDPALNDLVKRYPDALKSVIGFGGALDYASPAGYLGSELFSFMIPLLLIIAAVAAGSGAVGGRHPLAFHLPHGCRSLGVHGPGCGDAPAKRSHPEPPPLAAHASQSGSSGLPVAPHRGGGTPLAGVHKSALLCGPH